MKNVTICMRALTDAHKEKITRTVEAAGYAVQFFDEPASAQEAAKTSEIIMADGDALLPYAEQLRWFCASFAGVDHLLKSPYLRDEVLLSNSSGAYGVTIAEHIVMVTLMLLRRQMEYTEITSRHSWERNLPVRSIRGSRIVIVGTGNIGHETAVRMRAFLPAEIVGVNRSGKAEDPAFDRVVPVGRIDEVLSDADILILCIPGTKESRHLLNAARLESLNSRAMLVNVGRGQAIDQEALVRLLREKKLAGAALDVFETEPVPPEDPVWTCPGLLVTPHCSGNTSLGYTVDLIADLFCEDFERYVQGLPLEREVDRTLGY
ncbi:MAG: D-2-hydroxyacid dehydrogenase [Clostridia bacterium]|nr:D-2-hydroxyacid dehydrogenase [Clostridia bacterium]